MSKPTLTLDEAAARRVLMVQAWESADPQVSHWTADDRATATRLARETTPADAPLSSYVDERSRHALHMIEPRDRAPGRALDRRLWSGWFVPLALLVGLAVGIAVDSLGGLQQRIDLLAPPVWAVVAWNLVVYLTLLLPAAVLPKRLRGWLARRFTRQPRGSAPLQAWGQSWLRHGLPLALARSALVLHLAAAALAAGLVAGLYLRGLVLDYRAGWQSTFLDAGTVHALLATLLAPASALTGVAIPDVAGIAALRVGPGPDAVATATAAPWIHLYAATLALAVIAPRLLLALVAAVRARWLARRIELSLDDPYFQRLLREHRGGTPHVQLLPHGAAPSPQATLGIQSVLSQVLGPAVRLAVAAPTAYGDEESAQAIVAEPATTLRLALVDLGATPEDDTHGRYIDALRAGSPGLTLLLLADATNFMRRFGGLPDRLADRRRAWRRLAETHGVGFVAVALDDPDLAAADADFDAAMTTPAPAAAAAR